MNTGEIPNLMHAMVLEKPGGLLKARLKSTPEPAPGQILVQVQACGVCRTDLHILDGELKDPHLPLIPGHEIVGTVVALGSEVKHFRLGARVGIPWLGYTCGVCKYCRKGQENLCENPQFTGYTINGGYAQYTVADARYCFPLPASGSPAALAPWMCAGLIGYRSYRLAGTQVEHLGVYGFGAAAHIITQIAVHQGKHVYAFTSPGDIEKQAFARRLGADWTGGSDELPPHELDAALIFAPVGALVPAALRAVGRGGVVVCGGIHMSDIPAFSYELLWEERMVRSVANLTRQDGEELLMLAQETGVKTEFQAYPLDQANQALDDLRCGRVQGAAVLVM
jgi:alcohol dehydrogenase, propanol-preferring